MYIWTHTLRPTHTHMYSNVYTHNTYMYVVCIYTCICMYAFVHTYVYIHIHTNIHTDACTDTCRHTNTHAHKHKHTDTHENSWMVAVISGILRPEGRDSAGAEGSAALRSCHFLTLSPPTANTAQRPCVKAAVAVAVAGHQSATELRRLQINHFNYCATCFQLVSCTTALTKGRENKKEKKKF